MYYKGICGFVKQSSKIKNMGVKDLLFQFKFGSFIIWFLSHFSKPSRTQKSQIETLILDQASHISNNNKNDRQHRH